MIACIDIVRMQQIKPFLLEVIGQQWLDLMKINIKTNDYIKKRTITKNSGRRGRTR
jgi:hypothetical protein